MAKTHRKRKLLEELKVSHGLVTIASKKVGINPKTFYAWLKTDPEFRADYEAIRDVTLDFVESKLMSKIDAGDTIACMFYLKCKGKSRGFVERTEQTIDGNLKLAIEKKVIKEDK